MYMGNTAVKFRSGIADRDEIKYNSKHREKSKQSIRDNQDNQCCGRSNNSNTRTKILKINKQIPKSSLRVSILINEAYKNRPSGPLGKKCKEDIV